MSLDFEKRLMPAVTVDRVETALALTESLLKEGLDVMEITFRTQSAVPAIKAISREFPEMTLGAGTILTPDQISVAQDAGARFGLAPGLNERIVKKAHELEFPFIPGVTTASEIEQALELGVRLLKLFPVKNLGGASYVKSLQGPYQHTGVEFIPMGGVNLSNLDEYLRLTIVKALGGSWMTPRLQIREKKFDEIRNLIRQSLSLTSR